MTATATTWRSDYYTLGSTYPQCTARSHLINIFNTTVFKNKRSAHLCCDTADIAHSGLWRPCSRTVECARHEGQAAVQERLGAAAHAGSPRPAALPPARQRCLDGQRRRAQQQPRTQCRQAAAPAHAGAHPVACTQVTSYADKSPPTFSANCALGQPNACCATGACYR